MSNFGNISREVLNKFDKILSGIMKYRGGLTGGVFEADCLQYIAVLLIIKKKSGLGDEFVNTTANWVCKHLEREGYSEGIRINFHDLFSRMSSPCCEVLQFLMHLEIEDNDYLNLLDYAIDTILKKSAYPLSFSTPDEICKLYDFFIGDRAKSIYNPFSGVLNFATSLKKFEQYQAVESDLVTYYISMYRMILSKLADKVSFNNDSVINFVGADFDAIVANPPLGINLFRHESRKNQLISDEYVWSVFEEFTNDNGIAVSIVRLTELCTENDNAYLLRKKLIEKGHLSAVVLLPGGILKGTSVPTALVVIDKNHSSDNPVWMVDASSMFIKDGFGKTLDCAKVINACQIEIPGCSRKVYYDEIRGARTWDPAIYVVPDPICPDGYKVSKLNEIVSEFKCKGVGSNRTTGLKVSNSDLAKDWYNCEINVSNLNTANDLTGYYLLNENAVLISAVSDLKPSIINASKDCPVYVKKDIIALIPSPKVDSHYLCMALSNLDSSFMVAASPRQTRFRLFANKLAIPELGVQHSVYSETVKAAMASKIRELGLQDIIEKMKREYINEVRLRKHDMIQDVRELWSIQRMMSSTIESFNDITSLKKELGDLIGSYINAMGSLTKLLDDLTREEEFDEPSIINIDEFFKELVDNNNPELSCFDLDYDIDLSVLYDYLEPRGEVEMDEENDEVDWMISDEGNETSNNCLNLFIKISKNDLRRVIMNILDNAKKHGFKNVYNESNRIIIHLSIDSSHKMFVIDIVNNGIPFPDGLTKERYGLLGEKVGEMAGTGKGGHIVKKIVEHFGGDFDILSENYPTIRLLFPIVNID